MTTGLLSTNNLVEHFDRIRSFTVVSDGDAIEEQDEPGQPVLDDSSLGFRFVAQELAVRKSIGIVRAMRT